MRLSYPDPEPTDGVLRLRRWVMADLECVRSAGQDCRIPADTSVPLAYSPEEGRAFIERQWSRLENRIGIALAIALAETDEAVGHVYLAVRPQPSVLGLGYWVIPQSRGHGYAARAARLATSWAFESLGAARVEAWVRPENQPSLRSLAAAGFQREGLLRSFLDFADGRSDMVVWACLPTDKSASARIELDHVQLAAPTGCEDDARAFYGGLLGLVELQKPAALSGRAGVWFALADRQLHIGVEEGFVPAHKAHPALAVHGRALDTLAARLHAAGAPVDWDDALPGVRRFYTVDPWGNRIELLARG